MDIVLGGLIALGGVIIGGLSSYIIARLQISAAREQLIQQLSHQEREAQRNRLIEARKDYLLPLRKVISEWTSWSDRQVAMIARLQEASKNRTSPSWKLEIREFKETTEQMQQLSLQLNILRGQISDSTLDNLIEAVKETDYKLSIPRMRLYSFFNDKSSKDAKTIEDAMRES